MDKYLILCTLVFMFLLTSCSKEDVLDKMEYIKAVGNENPQEALVMLDSLEIDIREASEYAKAKFDLLRIRLNDKADYIPTSDVIIKRLVTYFEEEGSSAEKQEAYYYAGSTYRDLQDTPRALEYFFKSLENSYCDSIMLRNTYSNLQYLYYRVQDYRDATVMAHKELDICKQIGADVVLPYINLGASYYGLDSLRQSETAYDSAYAGIIRSQDIARYQPYLIHLLCSYSDLGAMSKASKCLPLIESNPLEVFSVFSCLAFAQYYESLGKSDSAIIYCKHILDVEVDIFGRYDATKFLYRMYHTMGDTQQAAQYAEMYMQLSDSLDFGKRQELAATVSNQYKYHLDQKKELSMKAEKERYKTILVIVVFIALFLASIGYIFYVRRRHKHLQRVFALSAELKRVSENEKQFREDILQKDQELTDSKKALEESSNELDNVKRELQRVSAELAEYDEALKAKERQLSEKIEQNKAFVRLLYQAELDGKAEDVIHDVRQLAAGKKNMHPINWKRLYQAVDELYPTFKDRLLKELGTFTEQQMQVCYLMRIGLAKPQIQNVTNLSRVTVWRWVKRYDWISTLGIEAADNQ